MNAARTALWALCLALGACQTAPIADDHLGAACRLLYAELDAAAMQARVRPSTPATVAGFPHLRRDRLLATLADEAIATGRTAAALEVLAAADRRARQIEWAGLSPAARQQLIGKLPGRSDLDGALADCAEAANARLAADTAALDALVAALPVPDDYLTARRVLGLYPITSLAAARGVRELHAETRARFSTPLTVLPEGARLERFRPPAGAAASIRMPVSGPLGRPLPTSEQAADLLARHAPVWEIEVADARDLPGRPYWLGEGVASVDSTSPATYTYLSWTRFEGEILLQLNYVVWFAARPRNTGVDLLGGRLDGLVWRVTLDRDLQPLVYDSIHPCGCYHLLFPTPDLELAAGVEDWREPPMVPLALRAPDQDQRQVLRIAAGTHYLRGIYEADSTSLADDGRGRPYHLEDYASLYRVPVAGGASTSLFGDAGIIAGTERAERWLLWPMGIASPGAMRERGRQPIAFIGRRHFDDPDLMQGVFLRRP